MARTRSIWPEFFTNAELLSLSPLHRLLYAGLPMVCDWAGRGEDRPGDLKLRLLPGDTADVDGLMADLARIGAIERYERNGKKYFAICSEDWARQHPHVKEKEHAPRPPPPRRRGRADAGDQTDTSTGPAPGSPRDLLSSVSDHDHSHPPVAPLSGGHAPAPLKLRKRNRANTTLADDLVAERDRIRNERAKILHEHIARAVARCRATRRSPGYCSAATPRRKKPRTSWLWLSSRT